MSETNYQAFTVKCYRKEQVLLVPVMVAPVWYHSPLPPAGHSVESVRALWDTGANTSSVSKALAERLGLAPVPAARATVRHMRGESVQAMYRVTIGLPGDIGIANLLVGELAEHLGAAYSFVVGMDVIGMGDCAITNSGGETWLSFRTPSAGGIDFTAGRRRAERPFLSAKAG